MNITLGKAGLTGISGAATTHSIGNAIDYLIGGKAYAKASTSGAATPTTDVDGNAIELSANEGTVVAWCLDASGNVTLARGSIEDLDDAGNFKVAPQFPLLSDDLTPFAYTLHQAGSGLSGTFTVGVSNWGTSGMTHTVVDVGHLPAEPQLP